MPDVFVKVRGYVQNHRTPTPDEVARILPLLAPEDALAIQLLAATGARIGEITRLPRRAIDRGAKVIRLNGKTGPRDFPLTPDLEALLEGRIEDSDRPVLNYRQSYPIGHVQYVLACACKKAGIQPFTPHALRRLAVDRMARAGVEVSTAASLTGHNPIVMLRDYRQVREEELLEAMLRADVDAVLRRCV